VLSVGDRLALASVEVLDRLRKALPLCMARIPMPQIPRPQIPMPQILMPQAIPAATPVPQATARSMARVTTHSHTPACVSHLQQTAKLDRQHTSAYVSIRQDVQQTAKLDRLLHAAITSLQVLTYPDVS
jgi:hypothetical protein